MAYETMIEALKQGLRQSRLLGEDRVLVELTEQQAWNLTSLLLSINGDMKTSMELIENEIKQAFLGYN